MSNVVPFPAASPVPQQDPVGLAVALVYEAARQLAAAAIENEDGDAYALYSEVLTAVREFEGHD